MTRTAVANATGESSMRTQQTDRDLMQLSAKAAGIKLVFDPYGLPRNCTDMEPAMNVFRAKLWNPLTDDGDALRLAVKLNIGFWVDSFEACCSWNPKGEHPFAEGMVQLAEEIVGNDTYAATRRAITRAAAEIGKVMS